MLFRSPDPHPDFILSQNNQSLSPGGFQISLDPTSLALRPKKLDKGKSYANSAKKPQSSQALDLQWHCPQMLFFHLDHPPKVIRPESEVIASALLLGMSDVGPPSSVIRNYY